MTKILVVDDESEVRELLRWEFGREGFQVVTVPSAAEALEKIHREPFDVAVVDHHLPDESGISVLKKIRQTDAKIPVIIYSGHVTADLEKEARLAGATEVLAKGIEITELTAQVKKFLNARDRLSRPANPREKRILVVDDEAPVRQLLALFLRKKGYTVLEAENGQRAIDVAASDKISAVLLDIQMHGMSGLTVLEKLLEAHPKLGVVMVTATQDDEKVKQALKLGAYGYVLKPFDFLYLELVLLSKLTLAEGD